MMNANIVRLAYVLSLAGIACSSGSTKTDPGVAVMMATGGVVGSGSTSASSGGSLVGATGGGIAAATGGAATGTGGSMTGGMSGTGGDAMSTGGMSSSGNGACTITPTAVVSSVIATVATVTFTTDLAGMDSAEIEFGLDTSYGMTATVDLMDPDYKTYLVGMKPSQTYHYRVVTNAGSTRCEGGDNTVQTGNLPNGMPVFTVTTPSPDKLNGGFIIGGFFVASGFGGGGAGPSGKPAFILDSDGDYVWAYDAGDAGRVRMSPDAKYMWIRNTNVGGGGSLVTRVSMDGTDVQTFANGQGGFGDGHHDFAMMPNGNMIMIDHAGCDTIVERSTDGTSRTIMDAGEASGVTSASGCHVNSIHYHPDDDSITFSDLDANHYVKIDRMSGTIKWIFGGTNNQFTGVLGDDATVWNREHGHHWPSSDHMLMFSNNGQNTMMGGTSWLYEVQFDETAMTATRVMSYDTGSNSLVLGDVQRLPNGNSMVTVSTAGLIQEIDSSGTILRTYSTGAGSAFGYTQARDSLYGEPPRW